MYKPEDILLENITGGVGEGRGLYEGEGGLYAGPLAGFVIVSRMVIIAIYQTPTSRAGKPITLRRTAV